MKFSSRLTDLVIASSGTTSNALDNSEIRFMDEFVIFGPAALTGTVTVQISYDGTNYVTLQSAGSDVTIAATKGTVIKAGGFVKLRVISGSAEGATRTFPIIGAESHT